MRLLTIIDSLAVGGAEQSLTAITPHLVDRGLEAHVAYLIDRAGLAPRLEAAGATVHPLVGAGGRVRSIGRTRALVEAIEPDLVHTTLYTADLVGRVAGRLAGVPVVSSFVTESYGPEHVHNPEYRAWKVRAAQAADLVTARLVDRFHAVSTASADVMARRLRVPRDRIDVVRRGRDPDHLGVRSTQRRARARAALGVADDVPLVLAAGRHFHMKGLDVLAEGFGTVVRDVPEAILVVAGREGPATDAIGAAARRGGATESIRFVGYRDDVPDLMAAADVFALPSRTEGSPGVLIEAMALEAPVVATDIPSVTEVAGDGPATMELVPVEDPEAMGAAIVELLSDEVRARGLAAAARDRFLAEFTLDVTADRMVGFYDRVIGATRAR